MRVLALHVEGVRNLAPLALTPGPRFNVFHGDNGQGKTNFVETLFVVAALRSFRTSRLADLIAFGGEAARIRARVERHGLERVYDLTIAPTSRLVRLDGKAVRPLAKYFGDFNVVLFAPEDLHLPRGAPADRRRFLDRAVFNRRGDYLGLVTDYDKVLRSRNAILRGVADGKTSARQAGDLLAVYDAQAATLGAGLIARRRAYLDELRPGVLAAWAAIARNGLDVDVAYETSEALAGVPDAGLEAALAAALIDSRGRDLARGATSIGPHRDDLAFRFRGVDAGGFASQGQLRALVLAWKIAELELLARVHGEPPILLLDDVSSELDPQRNEHLFEYLAQRPGQCFITTTRPAFVRLSSDRVDYEVRAGQILS